MKHLNWLIKAIFYKHTDERVYSSDIRLGELCCLDMKYQYQIHFNLCPEACENMVKHYHHESISTLEENPRGIFEGRNLSQQFIRETLSYCNQLKTMMHKYGPILIIVPMRIEGHVITMIGYSNDHIIYHDSLTGPNRIISFDDLKNLYEGKDIITAHHPHELVNANILHQLNDHPDDLVPNEYKKYSRFFTIRKMESPQHAILELLNSYIDTNFLGLTLNNQYRKELIREFIVTNREKPLDELLDAINNELKQIAEQTNDELTENIVAINYFCPVN